MLSQRTLPRTEVHGLLCVFVVILSFVAGLSAPVRVDASATLVGGGVTTTSGASGTPATPPATYDEPLPAADAYSDSVGATPATFRVDESGASTYSAPIYLPAGTANLAPALSLEYNNRAANGPMGPGWTIGGLSAITRCKKGTEYGDGTGPFPSVNFDGVAADQAYCLDGSRLLDLNAGAGSCPAGQSGDTAHVFGLELDPSTRICGYTKATNYVGYVYWLVQPKDGSYRVYGTAGNSALVHNDGQGNADTSNFQYLSWAINRIADPTGNTIEFSYTQSASTGEMNIAEVDYTGKIAIVDMMKTSPTFTRSPFAKAVFSYTTLPAASQRIDYVSGMKLAMTQQLTTVTASGPQNHGSTPDALQTVRVYHLRYGTPTSSGLAAMTSLQECAPNGANEVCYPRTTFQWDFLRGSTVGYPSAASSSTSSGLQYAIDYKVGDVDGDGRQDLVWVKDQSCDSTGSGSTRFQIMVSLANSTGFASPLGTGVYLTRPPQSGGSLPACGADWQVYHFETLWFLYDFTGDGRDDLLASNGGTTWKIFPTISVSGGYAFDGAHPVDTGMFTSASDDGIFLDLNADGLPDLIHVNGVGTNTANLLIKQSSGTLTFNFDSTNYIVNPTRPPGVTDFSLGFSSRPGRNVLNADLNGDGAADLVLKVIKQSGDCTPQAVQGSPSQTGSVTSEGATIHFMPSSGAQPDVACLSYWYTYRMTGFTTGASPSVNFAYETLIGQVTTGGLSADGSYIYLADLNGDGQADLAYGKPTGGSFAYYYRINGGKAGDATATERFLPEQSTGLTLAATVAERVQFLDVNGDHRTDIVYQDSTSDSSGSYPMKTLLWGSTNPSGFGSSPIDIGNSTLNAQNPASARTFFMDVDGNGGPDYITVVGSAVKAYGFGPTFGGNDYITTIINGLGAQTSMSYYPLAYNSGYTRSYDGPANTWGRGSPVFDVFSSIWVVHSAASTSPVSGAGGATALSSVVYRYGGAKIQAGSRGFLGFNTVQAENQQVTKENKYLVTTTQYRQDFPFVGRATQTVVELESALQPDPCNASPGDTCFTRPDPPCGSGGTRCNVVHSATALTASIGVGGQLLSDASDQFVSNPTFAAGTVQPVMPYLSSSDEQKFDLASSGTLSHEITSSFTEDTYGNLTSSTIVSSESSGTDETKATSNIFGCTVAPPKPSTCTGASLNAERQRLGRLSISTVTSTRGTQTNVRRASFEYDATTLLKVADIQGPYDDLETNQTVLKTLGLRTDVVRDGDGNVVEEVQCSTYHFANRSACTSLSGFQQRQYPTDLTKIQRYATWEYDTKGRFVLDKKVPFYDGTAAGTLAYIDVKGVDVVSCTSLMSGSPSARAAAGVHALTGSCTFVVGRDAFGNPLNSLKGNGDQGSYAFGLLGRAHFAETTTTGDFSKTTYTWCQDVVNTDISSMAPRANCPVGAVYRVTTDSTASGTYAGQSVKPTTWTYYDILGREMLNTKRIFQQDPEPPAAASKLHWSSMTTTYDSSGRSTTVSTPYFSVDPTATQGAAATRAGAVQTGAVVPAVATTTYDAIDRATDQTHPAEAANGVSDTQWTYAQLSTSSTNPRSYVTTQTKNARNEVMSVLAPDGQSNSLTVTYNRDAVGNLTSVQRTPSDGNSAGVLIQTNMGYDRLGRKTSVTDPDKGGWTYNYNALGDLTSQIDANGQTQTIYRDALGRMYQRTETRLTGQGLISEPTSTWEFDTSLRSDGSGVLGMLHTESNGVGGFSRSTSYNDFGRVVSVTTQVDSYTYFESQTYDQFGRPFQHFDPSTNSTSTAGELSLYSNDGYPIGTQEASDSVNGILYDQVLSLSQRGQVTEEEFHENAALTTIRTFDDNTGRMLDVNTDNGLLQNWTYEYDKHSNVSYRYNHATSYSLKESFGYDDLDRLHTVTLAINGVNGSPLTVNYDQLGNLTSKVATGTQTWTYGTKPTGCALKAGPHAVSAMGGATFCYDANGNQISANYGGGNTRAITYTGYDLPAVIQNTYPIVATESFAYAPDRSMWKRAENASAGGSTENIFCNGFDTTTNTCPNSGGGGSAATYYVSNVEARVSGSTTTTKRYINGFLIVTNVTGSSTSSYAYLLRDALGSIDAIVNENAGVIQRQSFDSWGNRRDASSGGSWSLLTPSAAASFDTSNTYQGYTGHQQLDPVGLVHMKGRLYDPSLGRFIQADSQAESDPTQGLNRYSYVLNNPLSLTDPTGYLSFRQILGIAIGVVAACFGQWEITQGAWGWAFAASVAGGFLSSYVATGSLKAGLWGAFAGAVFFGIGAGFSQLQGAAGTGFLGTGYSSGVFAADVAAHAAAGGVVTDLQGGNFGNGFWSAGATEALSPAIENIDSAPGRIVSSALVGGTVSKATGGSFTNGATSAALASMFTAVVRAEEGVISGSRVGSDSAPGTGPVSRTLALGEMDVDGEGPPAPFRTAEEAVDAAKALITANPDSQKWEFGGAILQVSNGFLVTEPVTIHDEGNFAFSGISDAPDGARLYAIFHNHPDNGPNPNWFSRHDVNEATALGVSSYIFTPQGTRLYFAMRYDGVTLHFQPEVLQLPNGIVRGVSSGIGQ